jgi:PAS domain S-box-containing protein
MLRTSARKARTGGIRRPPGGAPSATAGAASAIRLPLATLLAHATSLADVLPHLHRYAISLTGGTCSLLFEHNARSDGMQATSGYGIDALPIGEWAPSPREAALISKALSQSTATMASDAARRMPKLAARLGTRSTLLLPLAAGSEPVGLLAIGLEGPAAASSAALAEVADTFVMALEFFRLRRNDALQLELRGVLDRFAEILGATLNLSAGLETFCFGANRLLGADRTAVWVHDRRARALVLQASSDSKDLNGGTRVDADDLQSPAASRMRRAHAEIHAAGDMSTVTVPLRGCRRALGTLVFEGVRVETGGEFALLDRADELGRQLSGAIETIQLLDDVVSSRRELENIFDSIAHLVAVWDQRGLIVHVNHAFASRVGLTRQQLVDRPMHDFVGPELRSWLASQAAGESATNGDTPANLEVVDPVLKGPFLVTVTALRNHDREQVGSVLVARDVTPQARLQAEREELRQRLTQSEKLAALGQFVAGIAHELNNPLQGVLGHLELLRVTGAFPKSLRREVQTIYREADRAAKIVRNLLAFSGSRRIARRAVSLNAMLQRVIAVRAPACRAAGIEVVRHYDETLPRVQSDPLLLHQVFSNIVTNAEHAIAATGHGGRIEIRTSASPAGDRIVVSVRDTGPGIPADVLSRIFEPFYTTKEVGQGTGLGLAITYGIVQEHGGQIVAANHPGGGAVFTVELPSLRALNEPTEPAPAAGAGQGR